MKEIYFGLTERKDEFSGFEMIFYFILLLFVLVFAFGGPAILYSRASKYVKSVNGEKSKKGV